MTEKHLSREDAYMPLQRRRRSPHHRTSRRQQGRPHDAPQGNLRLLAIHRGQNPPMNKNNSAALLRMFLYLCGSASCALSFSSVCSGANRNAEWCKNVPRPEYKSLEQVPLNDPWFEVYKSRQPLRHLRAAPGRRSHLLPHRWHQASSALRHRHGHRQHHSPHRAAHYAGPSSYLTPTPTTIHGRRQLAIPFHLRHGPPFFTRAMPKAPAKDAQAEIAKDQVCGALPKISIPQDIPPSPGRFPSSSHNGFKVNLGGRTVEIIATAGHTPDAISLIDRAKRPTLTGDTFYPGESGCTARKPISPLPRLRQKTRRSRA